MSLRSYRALVLCALLVFSCLFTFSVLPAYAVLQTANDSVSGAWQTNGNWSLSAAPVAGPQNGDPVGDTWAVTIDSHNINLTNASRTVDSLTLSSPGAFTFDQGTSANPVPTLTVNNALTINSGTFFARGATGTTINAGSFTNGGTFQVGGTSSIQNDVTINVGSALVNNGLMQVRSIIGWGGRLTVGGAATINNNGTLEISALPTFSGETRLNSSINNTGTVTVNSPSPAFTNFNLAGATYMNSASLAQFNVVTPLSIGGAGSTFTQTLGSTTISSTGSIGGGGLTAFNLNGGTLDVGGQLALGTNGIFTQNAGNILGNSTINVGQGGSVNLAGGTMTGTPTIVLGTGTGTPTTLTIGAGYLYNASTTASGSTTITGPFTVNAGRTFTVTGGGASPQPKTILTPAFTNNGTVNVTASGNGWHTELSIPSGSLTNATGGIINVTNGPGCCGANVNLLVQLDNQGTLNINTTDTNPTLGRAGAAHVNSGTINVNDTFVISGNSFTQTAGTFKLTSGTASFSTPTVSFIGGTIQGGAGTLATNVNATSGGTGLTLSPGQSTGLLDINGNVLLNANDSLAIEIGGTTQAALVNGYDWADILGTTGLGNSSLVVTLVNGFTPTPANTFTILTATGGLTGTFGNVLSGKITGSGYTFDVSYTGNSVILSNAQEILPAPEPSSLCLLGLGALVVVGRRRRKHIEA